MTTCEPWSLSTAFILKRIWKNFIDLIAVKISVFVAVKNFEWNIDVYFIVCFSKITIFYIVLEWKWPISRNKMIFRHAKKAKTDSIGFKMFEWLSNFSKNERYDFNYGLLRVYTGWLGLASASEVFGTWRNVFGVE